MIQPTKVRVSYKDRPLTTREKLRFIRRNIPLAFSAFWRELQPPKFESIPQYHKPGESGYESAPFELSVTWCEPLILKND